MAQNRQTERDRAVLYESYRLERQQIEMLQSLLQITIALQVIETAKIVELDQLIKERREA